MAFRFAHLADLHLDAPFRGVPGLDPGLAAELQDASLRAWDRAVDVCLEAGVDFVLLAGDVYDDAEAGPRAQIRFLRGLERLDRAGVPAFLVHGNHDPQGGRWPAVRRWPPSVTVFGHEGVDAVPVVRDGATLCLVHGLSYRERHVRENLAARFRRRADPVFQVGLLHASVGDEPGHDRYAPCSLEDLRATGLDYWALGHVHRRRVLSEAAPTAAYPGCLQARQPSEEGAHGLWIVDVDDAGRPRLAFRPADVWRFHTVELDARELDAADVAGLVDRLHAAALELRRGAAILATAVLRGPTPHHADLHRSGWREEVLRQLREQAVAEGGLWWVDVALATQPPLEELETAPDFVGDVVRWAADHRGEAQARVRDLLDELLGRRELRGPVAAFAEELLGAAEALWDEARDLAVGLLLGEAGGA